MHLADPWLHQVGIRVEVGFLGEPVESAASLGDGGQRQAIDVVFQHLPQAGDDEPYWLFLPSEAAVAAYHHRIATPPDLNGFLQEVRDSASGSYLTALAKGAALPGRERASIADTLHRFTGLPIDQIMRADLRVTPDQFSRMLLADQSQIVARADGRFLAPLAPLVETMKAV